MAKIGIDASRKEVGIPYGKLENRFFEDNRKFVAWGPAQQSSIAKVELPAAPGTLHLHFSSPVVFGRSRIISRIYSPEAVELNRTMPGKTYRNPYGLQVDLRGHHAGWLVLIRIILVFRAEEDRTPRKLRNLPDSTYHADVLIGIFNVRQLSGLVFLEGFVICLPQVGCVFTHGYRALIRDRIVSIPSFSAEV